MTEAKDILTKASEIVSGERMIQYGPKDRSLDNIAILWRAYLELKHKNEGLYSTINGYDVAMMMDLLKSARCFGGAGRTHVDNYIDKAGYASLAGEIACMTL